MTVSDLTHPTKNVKPVVEVSLWERDEIRNRVISSIRAQGGAADQQQQSVNRISLGTPHILLAAMPSAEAGVLRFVFSVSVPKCDNCACGVMTLNGVGGAGEVKMTVKM